MAFDNAYPNRKDWRKPYQKSARLDRSCRNHGACAWCAKNRQHKQKRREPLPD